MVYDGPDQAEIVIKDYVKIPVSANSNISIQFVMRRIKPLRKLERRPVFVHENCTGCHKCVKICPVNAITPHKEKENWIVLTDSKCIRCFCCAEVCTDNAVDVRRKVFGV
jgi:ferredoxin